MADFNKYLPYVIVLLAVLFVYNVITLVGISSNVSSAIADAKVAAMPIEIEVTFLKADDCDDCRDISSMITSLEDIFTVEVNEIQYGSSEADELIEKYDLEFAPTIILSSDASKYDGFEQIWEAYGTQEDDSSFVLRNGVPPYLDTETGEVVGIVDIIYLTDESCEDCYDVTVHKKILSGFGLALGNEETVDVNTKEGHDLLSKYNIRKYPTVILSSDADEYSILQQVWEQVGEVADDGSYVFTNMDQMQGAVFVDLDEEQ